MINFNLNKIPLVYSTTGDTEKEIDVYFNYPSLSIDFFVDFNQVHSIKCESVDDAVGKLGNLTPQKINNKLKQPLIVEPFLFSHTIKGCFSEFFVSDIFGYLSFP